MKKIFVALCLFLVLSPTEVFAQKNKQLQRYDKRCGMQRDYPVFVAGFGDYPPFSWRVALPQANKDLPPKYQYKGFVFDALKDALKQNRLDFFQEKFYDKFDDLRYEAKHGKVDLFFTAYYEDEKKSGLDYIYPAYFGNSFVVVSLKDKPLDVSDFEQLGGLQGVVRNEEGIRRLIEPALRTDTKIQWVDGPRAAFEALLSGKADFMISSPYAVYAEGRRFKVYDKLFVSQTPLRSIKLFAAFSKLSKCRHLKKGFEQTFNALMKDPAEKQKRLNAAIDEWVAQHADEEPLLGASEPQTDSQLLPAEQEPSVETQGTGVAPQQAEETSPESVPAVATIQETPVQSPVAREVVAQ